MLERHFESKLMNDRVVWLTFSSMRKRLICHDKQTGLVVSIKRRITWHNACYNTYYMKILHMAIVYK